MNLLPVMSLGLLVLSGMLLDAHRRSWKIAEVDTDLGDRDRRAARAQYLRRMRASGLIGMIGAMLIIRPLVPERPLWFTAYLLILVLLCGMMLMLALVDAFAASLRLRQGRKQTDALKRKLEAEIRASRDRTE